MNSMTKFKSNQILNLRVGCRVTLKLGATGLRLRAVDDRYLGMYSVVSLATDTDYAVMVADTSPEDVVSVLDDHCEVMDTWTGERALIPHSSIAMIVLADEPDDVVPEDTFDGLDLKAAWPKTPKRSGKAAAYAQSLRQPRSAPPVAPDTPPATNLKGKFVVFFDHATGWTSSGGLWDTPVPIGGIYCVLEVDRKPPWQTKYDFVMVLNDQAELTLVPISDIAAISCSVDPAALDVLNAVL